MIRRIIDNCDGIFSDARVAHDCSPGYYRDVAGAIVDDVYIVVVFIVGQGDGILTNSNISNDFRSQYHRDGARA